MWKRFFPLVFLAFWIVSCQGDTEETILAPYMPPTRQVSTPENIIFLPTQEIAIPIAPTTDEPCTNNLYWLEDLTIPDGSVFTSGTVLDKQWRVQNNGTCDWDSRYRLKFVGGFSMGAPELQALYPARSGFEAVIRIVFIAPTDPGIYLSEWQAYDPQDVPFGDPIYIDIVVSP